MGATPPAPPSVRPPTGGRRTQAERSKATRAALLDATIECLIEKGYAGTTTTGIARRAGVSRGAQLHHYPTKAELVTSAVERLATRRGEELRREAASRRLAEVAPDERVAAVLDLLWSAYSDRMIVAAIELWVAARTDPVLWEALGPFERRLGTAIRELCLDLFGEEIARSPLIHEAIDLTLNLMRGMALVSLTQPDPGRARRLLSVWKATIHQLFEPPTVVPLQGASTAGS